MIMKLWDLKNYEAVDAIKIRKEGVSGLPGEVRR
jgi:hypothetical protein